MDLGKINRDSEDRSVVWAAVVTAAIGLSLLLMGSAGNLAGRTVESRANLVVALIYFVLAYGVYRGSRAAAVVVVVLFLLNAAGSLVFIGLTPGWLAWTLCMGGLLWAGMRGVFAQHARRLRSNPHP
jgi:hypothetical protein